MDNLSKLKRSKNMRAIKSKNTVIEKLLSSVLWKSGYRFRKHCTYLPGNPDICIKKYKIAVFADGEFWHGKDWDKKKHTIHTNRDYWITKIENNIKRDCFVTKELTQKGWTVLRFWGKDITHNTENCVNEIIQIIQLKRNLLK